MFEGKQSKKPQTTVVERKIIVFFISQRNFFSYSLATNKSLDIKGRVIKSCVGTQRKTI